MNLTHRFTVRRLTVLAAIAAPFALLLALGIPALAQDRNAPPPAEWSHTSLQAASDAAKQSKKPVLILTIWAPGICAACDHWRKTVQADESVKAALAAFEAAEWRYNGLRGSVIQWTKAHGSDHDDPSDLLWVLDAEGNVIGQATPADRRSPAAFTAWLQAMLAEFQKRGGARGGASSGGSSTPGETAVEFVDGTMDTPDGAEKPTLTDLAAAKADGKMLFVYLFVPADKKTDFRFASSVEQCERLETCVLADTELAAVLKAKCRCIRLDGTDEAVAEFMADRFKVRRAPALVLIDPASDDKKPDVESFTRSTTRASDITKKLEKMIAAAAKR